MTRRRTAAAISGTLTLVAIIGTTVIWKDSNNQPLTCSCVASTGGSPVYWISNPSGYGKKCLDAWVNEGHDPNQCPG